MNYNTLLLLLQKIGKCNMKIYLKKEMATVAIGEYLLKKRKARFYCDYCGEKKRKLHKTGFWDDRRGRSAEICTKCKKEIGKFIKGLEGEK